MLKPSVEEVENGIVERFHFIHEHTPDIWHGLLNQGDGIGILFGFESSVVHGAKSFGLKVACCIEIHGDGSFGSGSW